MVDPSLRVILQQLEVEKSIDRDTLIEAIRSALEGAARKKFSSTSEIAVDVDTESLTFKVFEIMTVVDEVTEESREMSVVKAKTLNPHSKVGDRLKVPTEPRDFGRIAAQTAKQVIIQKIKDAERDNIYEEFKKREGELVTGVVKRHSHGSLIVGVDRAEAVLPQREQSPRESFKPGDRIRAFLCDVEKNARGPQVVLSRTSPELVRALFDLEVPEIYDGTIEIKGIAREPGSRTKIAVVSNDAKVDAVGACVGMKGSRVRAVVEELCGEKIDIVRWSEDPVELCGNALNPADILDITVDEENHSVLVIVPHDQLSLAIGKRGQNARLASRLMGWSIDIKSDVELADGPAEEQESSEAAAVEQEPADSAKSEPEAAGADVSDNAEDAGADAATPELAEADVAGTDNENGKQEEKEVGDSS